MNTTIIKYSNEYFSFLIRDFGFSDVIDKSDDDNFCIIYKSNKLKIALEKYRKEIELLIASNKNPEEWVNLFMLIEYFSQNINKNIDLDFYPEKEFNLQIENLDDSYKKQILLLSKLFKKFHLLIFEFFQSKNYRENIKKLDEFAKKRLGY